MAFGVVALDVVAVPAILERHGDRKGGMDLDQPTGSSSGVYELYLEGCRRLEDGDPAGAVGLLEQAVALEPGKASLREALARACFATSRIRMARREFEQVLALDPSNDYAHYGLGRALERQGRLAQAGKHFKLANALAPRPTYRRAAERIARRTGGRLRDVSG